MRYKPVVMFQFYDNHHQIDELNFSRCLRLRKALLAPRRETGRMMQHKERKKRDGAG
ncbi:MULTISPECIES: hypothetical protein [Acetobacter]|uniref:hypothetical protein n=1 Tax=Acetobacter TaxID=434 RepID=UPI0002D70C34|nr:MULTISPECIES: hypothetical protein [Acetobacter]